FLARSARCTIILWTAMLGYKPYRSTIVTRTDRLSARFNRSRSNRRSGLARSWRLMRFVGGMAGTIYTVSAFIWPHDASADFTAAIQRHCFEVRFGTIPAN